MNQQVEQAQADEVKVWLAKSRITEIRRMYGLATDLINSDTTADYNAGLEIYREIFTPDAQLSATGADPVSGPDAWAEFVKDALVDYTTTQHLIGSQVVTELELPGEQGAGRAAMVSYLHAWHVTGEGKLWTFLGNYYDDLVHTGAAGWQIEKMHLEQSTGERRLISDQEI